MAGEPAVSVVIPTYERRDYVSRAVSSVLAQTFADFELIVVDDGSTDGTGEALAGLDSRLRYHWQPNRGAAAARNAAIRLARGELVAFLDSDNRWLPYHLQVVVDALALHPQAVLVSTCPRFQIRGREPLERAEVVDLLPRLILSNPLGFLSCIAVRREVLQVVDGFDERLPVWEDSDLWLRLAMHGPFCLTQQRTIVHQSTRGGLKERGLRTGEYLRSMELSAERASSELRSGCRDDLDELLARTDAKAQLLVALRALARDDGEAGRRSLAEACRLLPELSRDPSPVLGILGHGASEPNELVSIFSRAALLWPDPYADTALLLRGYAGVVALRTPRWRQGARLLAFSGFLRRPGFLVRTFPLIRRLIRSWVRSRLHTGRESDLPDDSAHGGPER